jgi:hypothetical protein
VPHCLCGTVQRRACGKRSMSGQTCRFVNQDDLDFATAQDMLPTQEFTLNEDFRGVLEYPVKCAPVHIVRTESPESVDGAANPEFSDCANRRALDACRCLAFQHCCTSCLAACELRQWGMQGCQVPGRALGGHAISGQHGRGSPADLLCGPERRAHAGALLACQLHCMSKIVFLLLPQMLVVAVWPSCAAP